jgi:antitoxin ParD1/3/4
MNKLMKPVPEDDDSGPELSEAEMEAWIARNRDAINQSIIEADREFAEGKAEPWDFDALLADAKAEFEKSQKG